MDDLGSLVSAFVEERVDIPRRDEIDLWCEAVYASLFTVTFDAVMRLSEIKNNPEKIDAKINHVIKDVASSATVWMSDKIASAWPDIPRVEFDLASEIRQRVVMYFDEAIHAITERGFQLAVARSHSCFAILCHLVTEMVVTKSIPLTPEEASRFVRTVFEACESMSSEIVQVLNR